VHCIVKGLKVFIGHWEMFYLESRGVPPAVAERLIVDGFFDEVLRKLSVPEAVPLARLALHEKLPYEFED